MKRKITSPELLDTIRFLKVQARQNEAHIWDVVAEYLSRPHRARSTLNLNHISRVVTADSLVLVPGKVLAGGAMKQPVIVGAFQFSKVARAKIERAGGKCIDIKEFVRNYPRGSKVRILR